jgi:hypothetical protein
MKKITMSLPLLALLLAVTLSAFTARPEVKPTSGTLFFDYSGGPQMQPGSYAKRTAQPAPGEVCPDDDVLCGIWADEDPNNPGHPLQSDINALRAVNDSDSDGQFDAQTSEVDFKQQ